MKRIIFSCLGLLMGLGVIAQPSFVSTTPSNKNVVLEEYTGMNCGYCPDGHRIGNQFAAANPGRVVLINIHQGGYANGIPNYKTPFGDALAGQTGLTGFPSGTINRRVFPPNSSTALGRGDWVAKGNIVLGEASFVNVDAQATIDVQTRELTVVVEAYYTGEAESEFNMLNVALLQNNIIGPQSGGTSNPAQMTSDGKYIHNHMLRHLITGQWGDTIQDDGVNNIPEEFFFTKTYTYTIPAHLNNIAYEMGDFEITVFVSKNRQVIYTGTTVTPEYTGLVANDASINASDASYSYGCNNLVTPSISIRNSGGDDITSMEISVKGIGGTETYNWTGSISTFETSDEFELPSVEVTVGSATPIEIEILSINGEAQEGLTHTLNFTKPALSEANGNILLELKIDRYGSETTWNVKDLEGNVITSGGPYEDATSNGTRLITEELYLPEIGCYIFEILDSHGDGINAGFGAGGYKLLDANYDIIVNSNGRFGHGEKKDFNLITWTENVSLEDVFSSDISTNVYPNPAKDNVTLSISVSEKTNANIGIYDAMGREIISLGNKALAIGENNFEINTQPLRNGIYLVRIASEHGISTKKLNISK